MKRKCFYPFLFLILGLSFVYAPLAQEKREGEEVYTIKKGDTLWDISSKFWKDPFLWPKLWQRNPSIPNPHLIYPGRELRLEELRRKLEKEAALQDAPKEVGVQESKKEESPPVEEKPVLEKKEDVVKEEPKEEVVAQEEPKKEEIVEAKISETRPDFFHDLRSAGFIGEVDYHGIGMILDSKEGKRLMSEGDILFIAFKTHDSVLIGKKYTVIRASEVVRHPVTERRMGRKYNITGNIQIIDQNGSFVTAKVIEAFDAIQRGDMIQPFLKDRLEVGGIK